VKKSCIPGVRECTRAGEICTGYEYGIQSGICDNDKKAVRSTNTGNGNNIFSKRPGKGLEPYITGSYIRDERYGSYTVWVYYNTLWPLKPGMAWNPPRPENTDDDNAETKCKLWVSRFDYSDNICSKYNAEDYFLPELK
jgi:hypothetical protein